jgi:hypothetical protein
MAQTLTYAQVLGTSSLSTYATLYQTPTSPTSKEAVISTIVVCNTSGLPVTYRIGLMSSAGTPSTEQFVIYDQIIQANFTVALTLGLAMPAGRFIRVSSSAATLAFSAYVSEVF